MVIKNRKQKAEKIIKKLNEKGIQTRPFFWSLHQQPIYKKYKYYKKHNLPNSEFLSKNGFYLPSGLGLKEHQIKSVCAQLKKIFPKK